MTELGAYMQVFLPVCDPAKAGFLTFTAAASSDGLVRIILSWPADEAAPGKVGKIYLRRLNPWRSLP
jgi:hypothetical protein